MIDFYEVVDRAFTGRHCSEAEFEMEVLVPKVQEVISKYDIKYDPETPIPSDDDLADRVFEAGLELYRDVGTFCPDTERIIRFSEEELRQALDEAPRDPSFGEGKDIRVARQRKPDSSDPPFCFLGAGGAAVSDEERYASIMEVMPVPCPWRIPSPPRVWLF